MLTPRAELSLGPVEPFAEFLERRVTVVNLEELIQRGDLEPLEQLLTLVVRPEGELSAMIATILWRRLPSLSLEEIMAIAGIQLADLSETRAYQDILAKGREEGKEKGGQQEAAVLVLKQLRRRFGRVSADDAATIRGLSTAALEDLAKALLAFASPGDLEAWLVNRRAD